MAALKSSSKTEYHTIVGTHEHRIVGYSLLRGIGDGEAIASERFSVGGHEWVSAVCVECSQKGGSLRTSLSGKAQGASLGGTPPGAVLQCGGSGRAMWRSRALRGGVLASVRAWRHSSDAVAPRSQAAL